VELRISPDWSRQWSGEAKPKVEDMFASGMNSEWLEATASPSKTFPRRPLRCLPH
jgi:hypothetical protein